MHLVLPLARLRHQLYTTTTNNICTIDHQAPTFAMVRLVDLPPELLRRVCEFALPQGLTFSFHRDEEDDSNSSWSLQIDEGDGTYREMPEAMGQKGSSTLKRFQKEALTEEVQIPLLYVNKVVAAEARGKQQRTSATKNRSDIRQGSFDIRRGSFL